MKTTLKLTFLAAIATLLGSSAPAHAENGSFIKRDCSFIRSVGNSGESDAGDVSIFGWMDSYSRAYQDAMESLESVADNRDCEDACGLGYNMGAQLSEVSIVPLSGYPKIEYGRWVCKVSATAKCCCVCYYAY